MMCQVRLANLTGHGSFTTYSCTLGISGSFRRFVLVDNRDLTAPRTDQASLAHWPTVAAWWTSRLALHGPARELCDLIFIPIGPAAGLDHVHPTWAGTFVLAALVFLFPEVHFVLLDSDCVPVTCLKFLTCGKSSHCSEMD